MLKKILYLLLASFTVFAPLSFAVSTDTIFDTDTKLMLHMDGTDTSTTFTDSSSGGKTVTANGNAQIDTAQSKFGGASGLFDGTGDFLTVGDDADFELSSGDFSIDFWLRFNALPVDGGGVSFVTKCGTGSPNWSYAFWLYRTGTNYTFYFQYSTDGATVDSLKSVLWGVVPNTGQWYHITTVRSGNNLYFFVDGTQVGSTLDVTGMSLYNSSSDLAIGSYYTDGSLANFMVNGWIDELRIVKGTAVWTSDFTPPTSAYSAPSSRRIISIT